MKSLIYLGVLIIGIFAGFFLREFREVVSPPDQAHTTSTTTMTTICSLPSDQVNLIANQIAPLLLKQIANSNAVIASPQQASQKIESIEKLEANKIAATNKANDMVDRMLASGKVDQEIMAQAIQVLVDSGQAEDANRLNAKIAAAINRGDIKPEDAGFAPRRQ